MDALLLIAHGSRREQSNEEVTALADRLRDACKTEYGIVHAGFLELATPSITEAITRCVDEGAGTVTILPYFLNSGRHVIADIPEIAASSRVQHPNVAISVAQHLGASSLMVDLLIDTAKSTPPPDI